MSLKIGNSDIGVVVRNEGGSGGTTDYSDLSNKPSINNVTLSGNKSSSDLGIQEVINSSNKLDSDLVNDTNNTNKFMTTTEKTKLAGLNNYNDNEVRTLISNKVDKVTGKALSKNDYTDEEKQKLASINMAVKQDLLVSGQSIKTINGTSLLGSGNISTSAPTDAQVTTAVDDWLDAHPEASTTVQDGSISPEKLSQETEAIFFNGNNLIGHQAGVLYKLPRPVKKGETITASTSDGSVFSNDSANANECLLRFYLHAADGRVMDYYTLKNGSNVKVMNLTSDNLTEPIAFVSWNIDTKFYPFDIMLNLGDTALPYEEYTKEPKTPEEEGYELINLNGYSRIYYQPNVNVNACKTSDQLNWVLGDIADGTGRDTADSTSRRTYAQEYIDLSELEEIRIKLLHSDYKIKPYFYTASDGTSGGTSSLVNHPDNGVMLNADTTYTKADFNGARFLRLVGMRRTQETSSINLDMRKWYMIVAKKKKQEPFDELYYDTASLTQGSMPAKTTSGVTYTDDTAVCTQDILAFPYSNELKLKVHIDNGYEVCFGLGNKPTYLYTYGSEWLTKYFGNGDIVDIPEGAAFYRICIKKRNRAAATFATFYSLTPAEAAKVNLKLEIISEPLRKMNKAAAGDQAMIKVRTAQYHTILPPQGGQQGEKNTFKNPLIVHVSDLHGDYKRLQNAYNFAKDLKPALFANTGDTVAYDFSSGTTWIKTMVKDYDMPQMIAIGNHDVYPSMDATKTGTARFVSVDDADVYSHLFSGIETELGNTTNKLYYYRDIPDAKIRAIVTCLYEEGGLENSEKVRKYTHMKISNGQSAQLNWFASTVKSTPSGYGIVVLQHSSQDEYAPSEGYTTFFAPLSERAPTAPAEDGYNHIYEEDGVTRGMPFYDIIDAFIGKTTINHTYKQEAANGTETFTVTADFSSGVAEGAEFVAWLSGHIHHDTTHYVVGTQHKQLELNINTSAAIYGAIPGQTYSYPYYTDSNEQARWKNEASEDTINVYAIDRDDKVIRIVRIGNNWTHDMKERSYMEIPYTDDE